MPIILDIHRLRHFVAIVDAGSINAAAGEVHVSQPSLSASIKKLEQEVGAVLLERKPRGIEPTVQGRALYRHARLMLNQSEHALEELRAIETGRAGRLVVGVGMSFDNDLLPRALARFTGERPDVEIVLRQGSSPTLLPPLLEGEIDLALLMFLGERSKTLVYRRLAEFCVKIVARRKHPLARRLPAKLTDLSHQRFVALIPRFRQHNLILENLFLRAAIEPPKVMISTESLSVLRGLLEKDDLIALLPEGLARDQIRTGQFAELYSLNDTRAWSGVAYRREAAGSPMLESFVSHITELAKEEEASRSKYRRKGR